MKRSGCHNWAVDWKDIREFLDDPIVKVVLFPVLSGLAAWLAVLATENFKAKKALKLEKTKIEYKLDSQLRELLNTERIKAVSHFAAEIEKVREGINENFGAGVLAWLNGVPRKLNIDPEDSLIIRAKSNAALIYGLERFVNENAVLLGREVFLYFAKYKQAIHALAVRLHDPKHEVLVEHAIGKVRSGMYDDLVAVLEKTFGLGTNTLASDAERRVAVDEGSHLAKRLFDESVVELSPKRPTPK